MKALLVAILVLLFIGVLRGLAFVRLMKDHDARDCAERTIDWYIQKYQ